MIMLIFSSTSAPTAGGELMIPTHSDGGPGVPGVPAGVPGVPGVPWSSKEFQEFPGVERKYCDYQDSKKVDSIVI